MDISIIIIVSIVIVWAIGYASGRSLKIQDYEDRINEIDFKHSRSEAVLKKQLSDLKATWPEKEIQKRVDDYLRGMKINNENIKIQ